MTEQQEEFDFLIRKKFCTLDDPPPKLNVYCTYCYREIESGGPCRCGGALSPLGNYDGNVTNVHHNERAMKDCLCTNCNKYFLSSPEDKEDPVCPHCHTKISLKINPKAAFGATKPGAGNVSQLVMMEVSVGMLEGALKYGRHNYRDNEGIRAQTYYEATRRHLDYFWEGEDTDPDSGLSHIVKAIASLTVLRDAMLIGTFVDDRPPAMPHLVEWRRGLEEKIKALYEKYPEPKAVIVRKEEL